MPDEASKAWLKRSYAVNALRRNDPAEACSLLTLALKDAAPLKERGALLLAALLDLRAEARQQLGQDDLAAADEKRAQQMRSLLLVVPELRPAAVS